jgi:hypothetical protein
MPDTTYDEAIADEQAAKPAENAVVAAAKASREADAEEFTKAWNSEPEAAPVAPKAAEKPADFKSAFAAARAEGAKDFAWNGKKYTTALATDKKAAPVAMGNEARHSVAAPVAAPKGAAPSSNPAKDSSKLVPATLGKSSAAEVFKK